MADAAGLAGACKGLVEARGDGRHYKLNFSLDAALDTLSYEAASARPPGRWQTLRLPWAGFVARLRGRAVAGAPPLDPARIRRVGAPS